MLFYLKPTLACQTNASKKNNTGIIGIISASGPNTAKAPGNLPNNTSLRSLIASLSSCIAERTKEAVVLTKPFSKKQ